ncbi:MAG: recombination mediator RecR, partial [Chloroflexota bacterium]|nr:recombination mediator RecR [Chloroflexota bacterium]
RAPQAEVEALADAILEVKRRVRLCAVCYHITEGERCRFCLDDSRDHGIVCVVEQPLDVFAIERTGYRGVYHVLHGVLNPLEGVGPEQLRIAELVERVRSGGIREVIMATNPSLEGEATAMYIRRLLEPFGVQVTRLARGLPAGADLDYLDDATLTRALEGRQAL